MPFREKTSFLNRTEYLANSQIKEVSLNQSAMAGFRPNSEIIGKFRKLKKFYGHFVKRQK